MCMLGNTRDTKINWRNNVELLEAHNLQGGNTRSIYTTDTKQNYTGKRKILNIIISRSIIHRSLPVKEYKEFHIFQEKDTPTFSIFQL